MRAVIVQLIDHGETDRVVHALSAGGRVAAFAPGAKRSQRRFGGALEPLGTCTLTLDTRPRAGMPVLLEAQVLAPRLGLRGSLETLALGGYGAELAHEVSPEGHDASDVLALLEALLDRLDAGGLSATHAPPIRRAFELKLLVTMGYAPELDRCAVCGSEDELGTYVDLLAGGRVCALHRTAAKELGPRTLAWVRAIVEAPPAPTIDESAGLDPEWSEPAAFRIGRLLDRLWPTLLTRPLRSRAWLESVLRSAP